MARATPPLIPPKAAEAPPTAPKKDEPIVHETHDLRRLPDGKIEIVQVQYAEGLSEEKRIFVTESGPLAAAAWTKITRRKLGLALDPSLPVPPLDLKVLE
jgi:hypothetical protein